MIRLRHFLHPLRSAKSLYERLIIANYKRYVERQFLKLPRGERNNCWCGGTLLPFKWHKSYGVCDVCGSYVNQKPVIDLNMLYDSHFYWHMTQKYYGCPEIESRAELYRKDGRLSYWLQLIERYCPPRGTVIEVGCAPGVLLADLKSRGYKCFGVEPDRKTAEWIKDKMEVDVLSGIFPEVDLPSCDIFLAFDVLEHSMFPDIFMKKASHLLNDKGIAIIQTPVERYGYEPPFGERFKPAFNEVEHLFLFTQKSMKMLATRVGLEIINDTERLWLFHEVTIFKRPDSMKRC